MTASTAALHAWRSGGSLEGTSLGRYTVTRLLGADAFGRRYLATGEFQHPVMVALLHPALATTATLLRLRHTLRAASRFDDLHIARIRHGVWDKAGDSIGMITDFESAEPLTAYIVREGRVPTARLARLAMHVLHALAHAHDARIVHGHLRPEQIFCHTTESGGTFARVHGLHVAGLFPGARPEPRVAADGALRAPAFVAPEQLAGERADRRSDFYALAAVLYAAATGAVSLEGARVQLAGDEPLEHELPPLASIGIDVDLEFDAILVRGLQRDPAARYSSAADMAAAFRRWLERTRRSEPPAPGPSALSEQLRRGPYPVDATASTRASRGVMPGGRRSRPRRPAPSRPPCSVLRQGGFAQRRARPRQAARHTTRSNPASVSSQHWIP